MVRKTQEQFENEVKQKFPHIIVCEEYVNQGTKIKFRCKNGGHEWSTSPNNLFRTGCPICDGKALNDSKFKMRIKEKYPDIEILNEYVNSHTVMKCICHKCGLKFEKQAITLQKNGCAKCNEAPTRKLTDKEYKERINNLYDGNIIPLGTYTNQRTKFLHKCLKHNYEFIGYPAALKSGQTGCKYCTGENRGQGHMDTIESIKEKLFEKYGDEYELVDTEYFGHEHKMNFIHHLKDGRSHTLYSTIGRVMADCKCVVCHGKQIAKGFNDIATLDPEIASWFANKEETYIYTCHSNVKIEFICPTCGHHLKKSLNQVSKDRDVRCPVCKDGISYPNKLMYNIMLQIKDRLDFLDREYQPEWCKFPFRDYERQGIYDIYFGINGQRYIIEMDGALHYKDSGLSDLTIEESQYIDKQKDKLAINNNISIIRIDCNYIGFEDRYEYIKKNICSSILKDILPLHLIDFDEANRKSQQSLLVEACKMWDKGYKVQDIIEEIGIHKCNVSLYLKTGQKYGLCHNYSARESNIRSQGRKVVCANTKEIFATIRDAEKYYLVDGIGNCCEGKTHSAGKHKETNEKLFWLFYEDYEKMSDKDIEKFLSDKLEYEMTNDKFGKPVVCVTTGEQFMTAMDASRKYKVADNSIRFCCQGRMDTSGRLDDGTPLRWVFWEDYIKMTKEEIEAIKNSPKSRIKKVVCLNTRVLFNSATIAGEWCGVQKGAIRRSALNERPSGGKHPETGEKLHWMYYEDYIKEFDISTLTPYRVGA